MKQNLITIKCPNCGREYLPVEIYLPNQFFGNPKSIVRDDKNITFVDDLYNLDEEYMCDSCNTKFKVHAHLSFDTEVVYDIFDEDYTTELYSDRCSLNED